MKSSPRFMKLIGSGAIVATLAGGYFLVVSPFFEERAIAAQEIEDAEATVTRLEGELARVTLVRDGISEVQAIDADISRAFPSAAQIPQLTNDILSAAQRAGLSTSAVTSVTAEVPTLVTPPAPPAPETPAEGEEGAADPTLETVDPAVDSAADPTDPTTSTEDTPSAPQASLAEMNVAISATGTTEQLAAFLRELSNMERAFLIATSTLAGEPGEEGSLAISGKTFLYRPVLFPTEETEVPEGEIVEGETTEGEIAEGEPQP